jgi:gamma-glutamylcyclotransferase (GGCT)/AIG2-like uncharacterized protein YtfP
MHTLLFVYGSLLSSIAHPQGERLRQEATLLSAANLQARLYRITWYPAATLSTDTTDILYGELYRLHTPKPTLLWLDEYEGLVAGPTRVAPMDEFTRQICSVKTPDGTTYQPWTYLYQRDVAGLPHVSTGRWSKDA